GASTTGIVPTDLTLFNGKMLFNGVDSNGLSGLWITDGTLGGTHEIFAGAGGASHPHGLKPTGLTVYNGEVLVSGENASGNFGLWVTDGTLGGTHELTGIFGADVNGIAPSELTVFDGKVLFNGVDTNYADHQLWVTDGTAGGTHELAVAGAVNHP